MYCLVHEKFLHNTITLNWSIEMMLHGRNVKTHLDRRSSLGCSCGLDLHEYINYNMFFKIFNVRLNIPHTTSTNNMIDFCTVLHSSNMTFSIFLLIFLTSTCKEQFSRKGETDSRSVLALKTLIELMFCFPQRQTS